METQLCLLAKSTSLPLKSPMVSPAKFGAAAHGIAITVQSKAGDKFFVIWKATSAGVNSHELNCGCCDAARLEAHARGFIQNMTA